MPGDPIEVKADPSSPYVLFRGGVEDTPPAAEGLDHFNHTIDEDWTRIYAVKFNTTGTFTIKVTVQGGPRDGEYDTVAITVSGKRVEFDVPSTVVIGEKLDIKGVANIGSYVDIFIDDVLYAKLDDLVLEADGTFSQKVNTTEVGMTVPGCVLLKAWIDCPTNPGDDPPPSAEDGSVVIRVLEENLAATISKTMVSPGERFEVYGNASSDYVELVIVSPNGGNGTRVDGLYGTTNTYGSTFCTCTTHNFYQQLKVDSDAAIGNYTVLVLAPGSDRAYGASGYSFVQSILDLDGEGPELGAIDVSNKTQEEIITIIVDIIYAAGSDDFMWIGHIVVTQFETFDTGKGSYPSIMGTHNGTITIQRMYTYPCTGTGGHTEYVKIWNDSWNVTASWDGYKGDWHNITFDESFTLKSGETYNYTIRTGSYPQIRHTKALPTNNGWINCTEFMDANGKIYDDWIPAIRLWS